MTLPASGVISLLDLQNEFGGSNPIGLNEYYRGGGLVPNISQNASIPTSGAISVSNFYNATRAFIFNQTISSNTTNYNVSTAAISAGWDGTTPIVATITIDNGVSIYASSIANAGFTVPSLPTGSTCTITNNGIIYGFGGSSGYSAGGAGGVGLSVSSVTTVTNNGYITGGGGGGGAGADIPSSLCLDNISGAGGAGGSAIQIYANLTMYNTANIYGGGGGGGGGGQAFTGSSCGVTVSASGGGGGGGQSYSGGTGAPKGCLRYCSLNGYSAAGDGASGTVSSGGTGGFAGGNNGAVGGVGGTGGAWATAGASGTVGGSGGGVAGRAVTLSGGTFTLASNTGSILGLYT